MKNPKFRQDVQALRGLAVLLVVFYHAGLNWFKAGYLGVDIFFVISGYLIAGLIIEQIGDGRFSFRDFYYRRAKRILPSAYVVIALTTLAAPFFLSDLAMRDLIQQVIGALTFTANMVLWSQTSYFAQTADSKPLLHFWSLAVEEQYYLILPALLWFVPRNRWKISLGALLVASAVLAGYMARNHPSAAFYFLPSRFWEMGIGSLAAVIGKHPVSPLTLSKCRLPALAVLLLVPIFPTGIYHPGLDAGLVCVAAALLLMSPTATMQVMRPFAFVGDISYSLYLVHWPILLYIRAAWLVEAPAWAVYGGVALSFLLAWLLFRFIEEPFRRGTFDARRLVVGLSAATVLIAFLPGIVLSLRTDDRDFETIRRHNQGLGTECNFRAGPAPTQIPTACETRRAAEMLVWGDSYAMALVPGLAKLAGDRGLAQLTMSACAPALGVSPYEKNTASRYAQGFAEACIAFNDSVLTILRNRDDIKVAVLSSPFAAMVGRENQMLVRRNGGFEQTGTSVELAVQGLRALAKEVRAAGKRLAIVAPPPSIGIDTGECLERKARGRIMLGAHDQCKIPLAQYRRAKRSVLSFLDRVAKEADIDIIYLSDFLCDARYCMTEYEGKLIYRDGGHLSYEGSEIVANKADLFQLVMKTAR